MRVASIAWGVRESPTVEAFRDHLFDLVEEAATAGASLALLPELFCLELLATEPSLAEEQVLGFLAPLTERLMPGLLQESAERFGIVVVGGSFFESSPEGIVNVGIVARPGRPPIRYEKNNLTRYEQEVWGLRPGRGLAAFEHEGTRVGVTICYDAEFPESGRALAEAGCLVQLAPSYTESVRGFQRVRWCCLARAVENQVFVVHSSLVGGFGREPLPASSGSSAIIAPSLEPFPVAAILDETPAGEEGIAVADLDFEALRAGRDHGAVRPWTERHRAEWRVMEGPP